MRIAYLILAHGHPRLLKRLVARLPTTSPIFLHIDSGVPPHLFEQLHAAACGLRHVTLVPRLRSDWGSPNGARAIVSLIRAAVSSAEAFDYATLLSGVDYPIKSNAEIESFLEQHAGTQFIDSFPIEAPNRWSTAYGEKWKAPERTLRYHLRIGRRVLRTFVRRKLPYGLVAHGGFVWWTLSAGALEYIVRYFDSHPKFDRFLDGVHLADEFAIQTIVNSSPALAERIQADNLRFVVWDRPHPPWPALLRATDLEALRASNAHFARKMDDTSESDGLLDAIDARLLRVESGR